MKKKNSLISLRVAVLLMVRLTPFAWLVYINQVVWQHCAYKRSYLLLVKATNYKIRLRTLFYIPHHHLSYTFISHVHAGGYR